MKTLASHGLTVAIVALVSSASYAAEKQLHAGAHRQTPAPRSPASSVIDGQNRLAPGSSLKRADSPALCLRPGLEIRCRFRLDELSRGAQVLAAKGNEYLLRVDGHEAGHLSFFVQIEGKWESRLRGPVVKADTWYDVCAMWSGLAMTMNVNGESFKLTRFGRTSPGPEPLQVGPLTGVIDRLEIRNPSLERIALLAASADGTTQPGKPRPAGQTVLGGRSQWDGWQAQSGATCKVEDDILAGTFPTPGAMLASPALLTDLAPYPFFCLDFESVSPDRTGYVDFVTDTGTGTLCFQPQSGGRPTVVSGAFSDAWTGTLRRLAVSFSGGTGPIRIRKLVLADRPVGTPSFYIRALAAGRAKLRPGREETVVVGIQNVGGEAEEITARLSAPEGVKILGQVEQTIPYLGMDDFDMANWHIQAARPGEYTVRVAVSSKDARTSTKDLTLQIEPWPDLPKSDYVPKPRPAKTDYINLMHYCALWKEGTHYGWKMIEPWPERRPAIGWYDEGTPEVADWHIRYALEHGINGFIYCWYRAHYEPQIEHRLGHAIHDGLFNAKYRDMFTFTLMWENGCAKGVKDEADLLENLLPFWIKNYFTHPSYLKIDNQPVFFVWQPRRLIPQLGGPAGTKQALEKMRQQCRKVGFDGLRIIACMDSRNADLGKQIAESGWDAVSGYNLATDAKPVGLDPAGLAYRDHADVLRRYRQIWLDRDASTGSVPDIPNVVMGRDDRGWERIKPGKGSYIADPKAENFESACRRCQAVGRCQAGRSLGQPDCRLRQLDRIRRGPLHRADHGHRIHVRQRYQTRLLHRLGAGVRNRYHSPKTSACGRRNGATRRSAPATATGCLGNRSASPATCWPVGSSKPMKTASSPIPRQTTAGSGVKVFLSKRDVAARSCAAATEEQQRPSPAPSSTLAALPWRSGASPLKKGKAIVGCSTR